MLALDIHKLKMNYGLKFGCLYFRHYLSYFTALYLRDNYYVLILDSVYV